MKVSNFWAAALGYQPDEMIGRKSTDFLSSQSRSYAESQVLEEFFREGRVHNVEYDFVRKDKTVFSVVMSAVAQYDDDGKFTRSLSIFFDNTEAKRAQALLNQKQRAETIGRLVGGISHDFNNLLSVIQGSLEFLHDDLDHPDREMYLMDALRATRRGASLTQQLLTFGRKAHLQPRSVDINRVVRDVDAMLSRILPERIESETVTTGGLWRTQVDRHQLDTAILNLASNAQDAMPEGGKFTIETANIRITKDYVRDTGEEIEPGRYVMIAVSDTGTGISEKDIAQVFEPFFTTKPPGAGTGMGLAMVQGFVRQSSGAVRIYSEPGYGTTVKMYFPAAGDGSPDDSHSDELEEDELGDDPLAEIFVVEDEDDVRKVIVTQMRNQGYRVAEARTGDIAFTVLETGYRPRLLITDVVMPGLLQGPDLATRARRLIPDLEVIYLSGYPNEAAPTDSSAGLEDTQLVKPVTRNRLIKAVKKVLDRG